MTPRITINPEVPDFILHGYSASGALVVIIQDLPITKHLLGTEDDYDAVVRWDVNAEQARRISAVGAWRASNYITGGTG